MSQVEFGICGPSGVRPMKESGPDLILMGIGSAVFILAFAATGRALRVPESSLRASLRCRVGWPGSRWRRGPSSACGGARTTRP